MNRPATTPTTHENSSRRRALARPGARSLAAVATAALLVGGAAGTEHSATSAPADVDVTTTTSADGTDTSTTSTNTADKNTATTPALDTAGVEAWLDDLVPGMLDETGIAGGVVTVVADGSTVASRGYGEADVAADRPVDADRTLFRVGSVSKVVTAVAVLQQVERGDLDLDADVETYLDVDLPGKPVTLRHLLSHTAGFEERVRDLILPPGPEPDLGDWLFGDTPPEQVFEPGTVPAYSNYGYALAGAVVERVTGTDFADYAEQMVFEPLGMASSSFAQPLPGDLGQRLSSGYTDVTQRAGAFEVIGPSPAGSLSTSGTDMAALMHALLGEPATGEQILSDASLELLHGPALDGSSLLVPDAPRMTLGLFDESTNGHRVLGHGGDTNLFHSHVQLYVDEGVGIFVSLNSSGTEGLETLAVREELLSGFAQRWFPDDGDRATTETARAHAQVAQGVYETSRTSRSTFLSTISLTGQVQVDANDDGTITVTPGLDGPDPARFREVEPWTWEEVDSDRRIAMALDDDGQVEAIGFGSAFTLLPVGLAGSSTVVAGGLALAGVVLVGDLAAAPIGWWRRRREAREAPATRRPRRLRRLASVAALTALGGWAVLLGTMAGLVPVPDLAIRAVQGLQLLGVVGAVPAAVVLADAVTERRGTWAVVGHGVVLAALVGLAWFSFAFHLVGIDISY